MDESADARELKSQSPTWNPPGHCANGSIESKPSHPTARKSDPSLLQQFCHRCSEGQDTGGFRFNLDTLAICASH